MAKISCYILLLVIFMGCSNDDAEVRVETLASLVSDSEVAIDGVIACAAGTENENEVVFYLYPRPGVSKVRYFETESAGVDKNDYDNYTEVTVGFEGYFNGFLLQHKRILEQEKWVIISFEENGVLQLSNPIRTKQVSQNTVYRTNVHLGFPSSTMPEFSWGNIAHPNDVIYFEVVSDTNDNLFSGTYTIDTVFQYYDTNNVVLNITPNTPPMLLVGMDYNFTLLGVSEDNWVNTIAHKPFSIE